MTTPQRVIRVHVRRGEGRLLFGDSADLPGLHVTAKNRKELFLEARKCVEMLDQVRGAARRPFELVFEDDWLVSHDPA